MNDVDITWVFLLLDTLFLMIDKKNYKGKMGFWVLFSDFMMRERERFIIRIKDVVVEL